MTEKIEILIAKYFVNQISPAELIELKTWVSNKENKKVFKQYVEINYGIEQTKKIESFTTDFLLVSAEISNDKRSIFKLPAFYKYAAAVAVLFVTSYYLTKDTFFSDGPIKEIVVVDNDIEIGSDKATLTLDDGSKVALEKGKKFVNETVNSDGEKLVYEKKRNTAKKEIAFNFLTVPRGGEFYIELADNTKVWLNSDSKIKYPVEFIDGETREVELIYGEAYFDVSPSTEHGGSDFKVVSQGQYVEVLGTEFNIKAYMNDEEIKTTLVEGKVAVNIDNISEVLQPSQQSVFNKTDELIEVQEINTAVETSWRYGEFNFNDQSIQEITKVLERWYDVEIEIQNEEIENLTFKGTIGKDQNIEIILLTLKNTKNISYEIEDSKVIIK